MPPGAGMIYVIGQLVILLVMIPVYLLQGLAWVAVEMFRLVRWCFRSRAVWRAVPWQAKSRFYGTAGAFGLVLLIGGSVTGLIPLETWLAVWLTAAASGFCLLYLLVGVFGPRLAFNPMEILWWSALAVSCAGALLFFAGVV